MPDEVTIEHQKIHNLLPTLTVVNTKDLIDKVGKLNIHKRNEDHEYWSQALNQDVKTQTRLRLQQLCSIIDNVDIIKIIPYSMCY